jgi:hypothetical protein
MVGTNCIEKYSCQYKWLSLAQNNSYNNLVSYKIAISSMSARLAQFLFPSNMIFGACIV